MKAESFMSLKTPVLDDRSGAAGGIVRGRGKVVTSMATAMSGEQSSQDLSSCSTFRRTWGRIRRSRFSPNFCSFTRTFLAGMKLFRSSGSLVSKSKYLQFQGGKRAI